MDEDAKRVAPGNFERHWGLLHLRRPAQVPPRPPRWWPPGDARPSKGRRVPAPPARGGKYRRAHGRVPVDDRLVGNVGYACGSATCMPLGYRCRGMPSRR
uniref:Uncharacterized protein n=1 Tax=Setaria italica TaxID=4555 RepID=K4A4D2_SETIT